MSDSEKQLDQLISNVMAADDVETQPSANFKQNVMVQAALLHARHKSRFGSSGVWVFYMIGIVFYGAVCTVLVLLWNNGAFSGIVEMAGGLLEKIMVFSPIRTLQLIVVGLAAYVVVIRGLFTAFVFKTTKQK